MIELQNQIRHEDINVCTGIAAEEGEYIFYNIGLQTANTIIPEHKDKQLKSYAPLNEQKTIFCRPIMDVLREHITEKHRELYHYVNIEEVDVIIVQQIDWAWIPIKLVSVETHDLDLSRVTEHSIHKVLSKAGFKLEHFVKSTAFYARRA